MSRVFDGSDAPRLRAPKPGEAKSPDSGRGPAPIAVPEASDDRGFVAEARARWGGSLARGRRRTIVRRSRLPPRLARRPGSSARPNPGLKKDDN